MPYLSLSLLGGFKAILDGELLTFETDKARALLAFLATEASNPHRRSELTLMFWPNSSDRRAARNLSQTLLRVRQALGVSSGVENHPFLLISRQDVQFNPCSNHQLDVARFKVLIRAYRQHRHENDAICNTCAQWLKQATALYSGEFLTGFFVKDSTEFEDWRLTQQEELHQEGVLALTQLIDHFEQQNHYEQVITYARQYIKLEAWSDLANLKLIRALAESGQPAAAINQYETYTHILAQQLNISPSCEITTLYEQIKRDRLNGSEGVKRATKAADSALSREEFRPVTIMVCNRRKLTREEGSESFYTQHTLCERRCTDIIDLYGGHRLPLIGNKCLISFGYPQAQEDAACRAVSAALAMLSKASPCGRNIGIGIHTGTMLSRNTSNTGGSMPDLLGDVPEIARACQDFAQPGTALITEAVARLIRDRFDCQTLGLYTLTGLSQPVELCQVLEEREANTYQNFSASTRNLTELVGRDHQLAQLQASWEHIHQQRQGQVIWLGGEPGIGKSRLVWELRNRVIGQLPCDNMAALEGSNASLPEAPLWLESHCQPRDQNTNLYPIVNVIEQLLCFEPEDTLALKSAKLTVMLQQLDLTAASVTWHLSLLLNLPTDASAPHMMTGEQRARMGELAALLLHKVASQQRPVVLVIEDLHWSDPSTVEWLGRSFATLVSAPCLILLTYRPSFSPPWLVEKQLLQIELEPLNPSQSADLVSRIAGSKVPNQQAFCRRIVRRTHGNPFFLEELTKASLEALVSTTDVSSPVEAVTDVPTALRHILLAQFDQLGTTKETAYWAAVLGHEFSRHMLGAVTRFSEQRLENDLGKLDRANLVSPMKRGYHSNYCFRHALIHETVYTTLPEHVRIACHRRVAETLEAQFTQVVEQSPHILAHHFERAGLLSKAVDYWLLAGQTAAKQGAVQEARGFLDQAVALIEPDDADRCWQALYERESVLDLLGEQAAQEADIVRLLEVADILDDDTKRAQAHLRYEKYATVQNNHTLMIQAADSAISAARQADNLSLEMYALLRKMQVLTTCGKRAEAQKLTEEILLKVQQNAGGEVPSTVWGHVAFYYMEKGDLYQAVQLVKRSVAAARREGDTLVESRFNMNLGFTYAQLGLYKQAQVALETGLAQTKIIGDRRLQAAYTVNLGFVHWRRGHFDKARMLLQTAYEEFCLVGEVYGKWSSSAYLGFLDVETEDWRSAINHLQRAQAGFAEIRMVPDMLEVQAARAYALLGSEKPDEACCLAQQTWHEISEQGTEGMDSPVLAHLYLIKVFGAFDTEASQACKRAAIQASYRELMRSVAKISDPAWQQSYLENVAEHRELVEHWKLQEKP